MTIRKYTDGMELKPGMYVNCEGVMRNTFAGRARRIVSVTPKAIQTVACGLDLGDKSTKLKRLIQWVCDTEEEATAMAMVSADVMVRAFQMERECAASIAKMKADESKKIMEQFNGSQK